MKGTGERKGPWDGTARARRDEVLVLWLQEKRYPSAAPGWIRREPGSQLPIIPLG